MLLICYVGLLLPVLGFVNIYFMLYSFVADHYQYAAMIVPCAAVCRPGDDVFSAVGPPLDWLRARRGIAGRVGISYLAAKCDLCRPGDVVRATIKENPDCWLAYDNLGFALVLRGKGEEAMPLFQKALELRPDYPEAHYHLGIGWPSAASSTRRSLNIERRSSSTRSTSRPIKISAWRWPAAATPIEATAEFKKALAIEPAYAEAHYNLGRVLAGRGEVDAAIAEYQKAIELRPDYVDALNNLGVASPAQPIRRGHRSISAGAHRSIPTTPPRGI